MGDMAEIFNLHRDLSKAKREYNRERGVEILRNHGIAFESKNDGIHLIVSHNGLIANYWPGTGKFGIRGGKDGRGVFNLLRALGIKKVMK